MQILQAGRSGGSYKGKGQGGRGLAFRMSPVSSQWVPRQPGKMDVTLHSCLSCPWMLTPHFPSDLGLHGRWNQIYMSVLSSSTCQQ